MIVYFPNKGRNLLQPWAEPAVMEMEASPVTYPARSPLSLGLLSCEPLHILTWAHSDTTEYPANCSHFCSESETSAPKKGNMGIKSI